ncbi:MAG: phosphotransferase [Acidimicrobiaceae bacterium]|nr:phosphotransferase [Acidimicrobiaceae bacterium]
MALPIPTTLDEITADWLTSALRQSEVISEKTTVLARTVEVLGVGEGFAAELARMHLSYKNGSGPATVIAKIPTSVEDNRNGSELLGVYERELRIYERILGEIEVSTPRLYYGDIEVNPDAASQLERIRKMERLPIWLLRLILWFLIRFNKAKTFPSVLIMEDLSPAEAGDQVQGCDLDRAGEALEAVALLHAATWGDRCPQERYWLVSSAVAPRLFHAGALGARRGFLKNFGRLLSDHTRELYESTRTDNIERTIRLHREVPQCMLHGDFRLDNMFFARDGGFRALIDWQLSSFGPAVSDIAYFICGSIDPGVSEAEIDALLARYHRALESAGVSDYPLEDLHAHYTEQLLLLLARMASVDLLDLGDQDGRGADLVSVWIERLDARMARASSGR